MTCSWRSVNILPRSLVAVVAILAAAARVAQCFGGRIFATTPFGVDGQRLSGDLAGGGRRARPGRIPSGSSSSYSQRLRRASRPRPRAPRQQAARRRRRTCRRSSRFVEVARRRLPPLWMPGSDRSRPTPSSSSAPGRTSVARAARRCRARARGSLGGRDHHAAGLRAGGSEFVPVVVSWADVEHIPVWLAGQTYYDLSMPGRARAPHRRLTVQPEVPREAPLGSVRAMPAIEPNGSPTRSSDPSRRCRRRSPSRPATARRGSARRPPASGGWLPGSRRRRRRPRPPTAPPAGAPPLAQIRPGHCGRSRSAYAVRRRVAGRARARARRVLPGPAPRAAGERRGRRHVAVAPPPGSSCRPAGDAHVGQPVPAGRRLRTGAARPARRAPHTSASRRSGREPAAAPRHQSAQRDRGAAPSDRAQPPDAASSVASRIVRMRALPASLPRPQPSRPAGGSSLLLDACPAPEGKRGLVPGCVAAAASGPSAPIRCSSASSSNSGCASSRPSVAIVKRRAGRRSRGSCRGAPPRSGGPWSAGSRSGRLEHDAGLRGAHRLVVVAARMPWPIRSGRRLDRPADLG